MKCEERRGPQDDGDLLNASGVEEERPESEEESVAQRQAGRPMATAMKHEQLVFEQEVFGDHRSYAAGTTQLRGRDGKVNQGEHKGRHRRVRVGQTLGAAQRCTGRESLREFAIRDPHVCRRGSSPPQS